MLLSFKKKTEIKETLEIKSTHVEEQDKLSCRLQDLEEKVADIEHRIDGEKDFE